jgi:hypothetical protein
MPKFRICIIESREYIHEIEAADADEAADIAKNDEEPEHSLSDQFRERTIEWVEPI